MNWKKRYATAGNWEYKQSVCPKCKGQGKKRCSTCNNETYYARTWKDFPETKTPAKEENLEF